MLNRQEGVNPNEESTNYPASVADPYHFDTDPDQGCEKICYGSISGSSKKGLSTRKILKSYEKRS